MRNPRFKRATVIGSGPNGLAAAIELARAGVSVRVIEAEETVGGGTRSGELTLPGFIHDICSAVHPLGIGSPFFRSLPLAEHGLEWIEPPAQLAHPFDDGTAAVLERSIDKTGETFKNAADAAAYRKLMKPLVDDWENLASDILAPLRFPRHPITVARFGLRAQRSARGLAKSFFKGSAPAVFLPESPVIRCCRSTKPLALHSDSSRRRRTRGRMGNPAWRLAENRRRARRLFALARRRDYNRRSRRIH
jgi:phytoene dehydrogenase-like protein